MTILYSIFIVALFVFIISSCVGLVRFWRDTKNYSTYYQELKDLKEKAEKQIIDDPRKKDLKEKAEKRIIDDFKKKDLKEKAEKQIIDDIEVKDNENNN